jgi:hypothetical protein
VVKSLLLFETAKVTEPMAAADGAAQETTVALANVANEMRVPKRQTNVDDAMKLEAVPVTVTTLPPDSGPAVGKTAASDAARTTVYVEVPEYVEPSLETDSETAP